MNETTVILTREILKDNGSDKEEMTRSHDTWVLLLVVSVLSTLLCVIVIICCLWVCSKYFCFNLSLLNWRQLQCYPNQPNFPPNRREFVDMDEIGEKIAELQASKVNSIYKTGTSEHLGYKPGSKNFSLPILPTPRSWTPSPPFPQTNHNLKMNMNHHSSCHNCCKNHCHHCHKHHECFTAYEDASRCQICSFEPTRKLSNIQKHLKDLQTPKRPKAEIARSRSAFHLPTNLIATINSSAMQSCPNSSQSHSSRKEDEEETNINDLNRSFSNSAASRPHSSSGRVRNKNDIGPTFTMSNRKSSISIPEVFEDHNNSLGSKRKLPQETKENVSESDGLFPAAEGENNNNPHYKRKLQKSASNKRFQLKCMTKLSKRPNTPMVFAQESVSSESSDAASALNRSSSTYWKLYHTEKSHKDQKKDFGDDSKFDAAEPSMSWDHLTPDLPLSKEEYVEAKAEVDPSKAVAVFHREKTAEENDSKNVNTSVQTNFAE